MIVAGCAPGAASPSLTSQSAPTPARAEDSQGQYRLAFELAKSDWRTTEAITGEATLSLIGLSSVDFGASGSGPIQFSFDEIGGSRHEPGLGTPDCRLYRLEEGNPISSPIKKSGLGFGPSAQPSDFDRWFATDPLVHLPAGDWKITAIADVWKNICPVAGDQPLRAAVLIHVTA
jgi:hypothetical protein